ncbi:MAG: NAD(P)-dependent oxidoreductase [Lachnospiraceae bacterium]|jgi:UDP-glucose 4-epimerase|nr:NAD(P)-dependent oxidoreductase [Lachnospiraceae bacterium]
MKTAVITGPTGAVGAALIREMTQNGTEVYAVIRGDSQRIGQIPSNPLVHVICCSLEELSSLPQRVGKPCQVFYHFAWAGTFGDSRNDMELQNRNVAYTLAAVKAAEKLGCHTFVGAGSQAEYGRVEGLLTPETPSFPENGYGIAKLCAGQMSRILCAQQGIRHVWTRILSVYGPCDRRETMIMAAIDKLLRGEKPSFTKGEQQWDYLYAQDAARALYLLGEKGQDGRIYCLGSGKARPLAEYIQILRDAIDPGLPLGLGEIPYGSKQVMHLCADITQLKEDTGFEPQISFEAGIKETIAWLRSHR